MATDKRITVLMSVYNGEKFLRPAIESILNQTYKDFDFVIYDDCSADGTQQIILSYNDPRIIYRHNENNQGLTKNLADGVSRAETDYIARMDADDIAYPERLEKQLQWMDEHKDITILGTPVNYFHDTPGDGGLASQPEDDATIKATLFICFTLMHPSIMIRRKDLVKHGLNYNPEYRCSQDHALYLDCIRIGLRFANMKTPLLYMRAHEGSISRARKFTQQECSKCARNNFLKATGIGNSCNDEEIAVYNALASGNYPKTVEDINAYVRFVEKIYEDPNVSAYFDRNIIRQLLANRLCGSAYHAIDIKGLKDCAIAARKTSLVKYSDCWSLKTKIKFLIKILIR